MRKVSFTVSRGKVLLRKVTSSRLQSFHKWGVLGSIMILSSKSVEQPKHYKFASIVCKTSHGQHTGMIQVGRHRAQLVESMSTISMIWVLDKLKVSLNNNSCPYFYHNTMV